LLASLGEQPDRAALRYEELRRRLILFFRLKRPADAEELTDEVMDRLARRVSEGVEILSLESYVLGMARFVLRERDGAALRAARALEEASYIQQSQQPSSADDAAQNATAALGRCLQELRAAERSMILRYYGADGPERGALRQTMAKSMGLSINALHNRALRLRNLLERCVQQHLLSDSV
jgi:DNA-directed RNA polymerase specialized sigma24 family protein